MRKRRPNFQSSAYVEFYKHHRYRPYQLRVDNLVQLQHE